MMLESLGLCQELRTLPKPGGLYEQDSLFVYYMVHALQAQRERRELDNHRASTKARSK